MPCYSRDAMLQVMRSFLGAKMGDAKHRYIIDTYNGFVRAGKSKGSKYQVKYTDAWCATTVSTCAILAGCTDIIPVECSCSRMIKLLESMGCYQPKDDYIAQPADLIFYNWNAETEEEDNGVDGIAHHIGLVESYDAKSKTFTVIEGNFNNMCQRRYDVKVGWQYIQGFGVPRYNSDEIWHTVVAGDTLTKLANTYSTTVDAIMALNPNIKNKNLIYIGQKIRIR